ncbi:hypothetical protein F4818DRAFT_441556 [Hypoxylon cercidicola]|nr:hypothetical protein F4818DRAFT_441556 [Hypoxylon cercidicola]
MALPKYSPWNKESSLDLESDTSSDQLLGDEHTESRPRDKAVKTLIFFKVYVFILHLLLLALISSQWSRISGTTKHLAEGNSWSPVQEFIEYEVQKSKAGKYGKDEAFGGPPTDEQDEAWDYLINGSFFNASLEELQRAGEETSDLAELTDGGYLASIGVYHELHCLRQIRLYVYKDIYYPHMTHKEGIFLEDHMDHCLEALRRTIMCYGNTALSSFYWQSPEADQVAVRSNSQSVCAKWDSIENWAYARKVSVDPDYNRSFHKQNPKFRRGNLE